VNRAADESEEILRLSLDAKAVVKLGMSSRRGVNRIPTDAADHDHVHSGEVVPVGLLVPQLNELSIFMVTSKVTADCLVDVLKIFWKDNKHRFPKVRKLLVDLDNGPENNSRRSQFMSRLIDLADAEQVDISLAYYPPYHSKYNPVERCFGVLENHWNGAILSTLDAAVGWASTMTWSGHHPIVRVVDVVYELGKKVAAPLMTLYERFRLRRDAHLPKYFVDIPAWPVS
jgi:hypothetical protein